METIQYMPLVVIVLATGIYGAEWDVPDATARVTIAVHSGFHPRHDEVAEVPLAELPEGPVRIFAREELPTHRDEGAGVLRFLIPGDLPPCAEQRVFAYFGSAKIGQGEPDVRLTRPRLRNLVKNGGFENGLDGWTLNGDRAIKAQAVETQPHSGKKCLRLDFDGKSNSLQSELFPVTPNTRLTLDAWMRLIEFKRPKPHIGAPVRVICEMYDENEKFVGRFAWSWNTCIVGKEWRLVQAWRDVPPDARTARVDIRNWWCTSTAFVDDIAVYVFQPPPCEVDIGKVERR